MSEPFQGRCLCGAVHYECNADPLMSGHCQCADCRKSSGTGHSSHLAVPRASVTISGDVTVYDKPADSGHVVSRAFCPRCGAPIYSLNGAMPDLIFLRASSLDDLEVFKPQMIVYASRGASWDISDTNLPRFEEMPPMMKG
ncbi:GFA family protein [Methylocystis hirsuta]|uniref:Aldehyde-activating protein n=1 Tax=Methylocystis hirsuta TaxID=369798 RepID=A0A3M9XNX1_9HYPH|nr:GFA family protein [Methylocystis hirsuta]RNJ49452.1 aldehyde-activating protein [Methylocystis hirsuta]